MQRSRDRFLTTHTGSLPRPDDLIRMMYAKEEGVPVDASALAARVRTAVMEVVRKQADAGVDLINDGEMSKPSYATYIKDRLNGFGGTGNTFVYQDLSDFPRLEKRVFGDPGRSRRKTPACNAEISVRDKEAPQTDADNLNAALRDVKASGGFMSAASPGVVSLFFRNDHYKDFESYIYAIADAMRYEYETVAGAGLVLQIDCPDLAMGRHIQYADLSLLEFRKRAQLHIAALNHAVANIPAEQLRMHLCWGNYEGPHHRDVPLANIIDIVFTAKPAAISLEAANPRHAHEWSVFENVKLPDGKVLIPGVIESKSNFIEHPELIAQRIARYAKLVGRENVIAGSDCGYGTWVGQAAVDPDVVFAKLKAMAEGAALASRQFWK
ncbi:MAG TPA: cobalamin-independent methionine synthase II family protein [Pseudolabrys sp.]|nr:cobalamin-independent methionine synthase II family protein [Pseudolabrys sp.]